MTDLMGEEGVDASKIRAVIRHEIKRYLDEVIAPGVAEAIAVLVKEAEARFEAKLSALERRPGGGDGHTSRDQVSS